MAIVAILLISGSKMCLSDVTVPWSDLLATATFYVSGEAPSEGWFFQRELAKDSSLHRLVFIHYFPPLPISIDNKSAEDDYWNSHYLKRDGEGGKYSSAGGYVRQRPLPRKPWNSLYWREIDALVDVLRAKLMGADGFGVDIIGAKDNQYWQQAERICQAAAAVPGFYFIPEIDGASFAKNSVEEVVQATEHFAKCPSAYRLKNGKTLFIPFAPDIEGEPFWKAVEDKLAADGIQASFVPDLLNPAKAAASFAPISDCISAWGDRDSRTIGGGSLERMGNAAKSLVHCWMQPVAPQDARPKSLIFWEASNTEMFRKSWMQAIKSNADYVQMITWNDYGEATQFAPSTGTQFLFYDLSAYFIQWYKTGHAPQITHDAIYYSHRIQIFDPQKDFATGDKHFKLLGATPVQNDVEMIAMLTKPATIEIELDGQRKTADVPAGLQTLRFPASPGRPAFRIIRNGQVAVEKISDWTIENEPSRHVPDYFGGSSTRAFIPPPQ